MGFGTLRRSDRYNPRIASDMTFQDTLKNAAARGGRTVKSQHQEKKSGSPVLNSDTEQGYGAVFGMFVQYPGY